MFWGCFGDVLGMFWGCFRHVLRIFSTFVQKYFPDFIIYKNVYADSDFDILFYDLQQI